MNAELAVVVVAAVHVLFVNGEVGNGGLKMQRRGGGERGGAHVGLHAYVVDVGEISEDSAAADDEA